MDFPAPLVRASLERRYKRFLSDHVLGDGARGTAHCANPGSMLGLDAPGSETWLLPNDDPARKLRYSWELVRVGDGLVGINTARPNRIVEEGILAGAVEPLRGYPTLRREVRYGTNSRIDILLEAPDRPPCYVEVKNVHLSRKPGLAEFPDAVTKRGTKHLHELAGQVRAGGRAVMLYLVQRDDCDRFRLADDIDPAYAEAFAAARAAGVEALCHACRMTTAGIEIGDAIAFGDGP